MPTTQLLSRSDCVTLARFDELVLLVRVAGTPTQPDLRQIYDTTKALVRELGRPIVVLTLAVPSRERSLEFDTEVRKESARLQADMRQDIAVAAQFVIERGFFGAIVRSIMNGINLVGRPPYPTSVFSDLGEGARWVGERCRELDIVVDEAGLQAALEELHGDAGDSSEAAAPEGTSI